MKTLNMYLFLLHVFSVSSFIKYLIDNPADMMFLLAFIKITTVHPIKQCTYCSGGTCFFFPSQDKRLQRYDSVPSSVSCKKHMDEIAKLC